MRVILLKNIDGLGQLGDLVNVKSGFARNYLIPQSMAKIANKDNMVEFEKNKANLMAQEQEKLDAANALKSQLDSKLVTVEVVASEEGKIFGSVGITNIVNALKEDGITIQKRQVRMPTGQVKALGEFDIDIYLHQNVTAAVKLNIVAKT